MAPAGATPSRGLQAEFFRALNALIEPAVRAGCGSAGFVPTGLIVIETTGAVSGRPRRVPLLATVLEGCVFVSTVRVPRAQWVDNLRAHPDVRYWLVPAAGRVAEAVLDRDPRLVFDKVMRRGLPGRGSMIRAGHEGRDANPFRRLATMAPEATPLLSEAEIDVYTRAYAARGFRGGINWYRNVDRNRERFPDVSTRAISLPCLMVTAEWDAALPPALAQGMPALCADLETHMIPECGHWTQQEKPDELNRLMVDWLTRRFPR